MNNKNNKNIFITAAPTGSVPRYIDPLESRFISDSDVDLFIHNQKKERFIALITSDGWEHSAAGGMRITANSQTLSKSLIAAIGEVKLIRKFVLHLTAYGWLVNDNGALYWPYQKIDSYITADLLKEISLHCPSFEEHLQKLNWKISPAGYYQSPLARSVYVPITADRISEEANECFTYGAAIVHMHTRELADDTVLSIPQIDFKITLRGQKNHIDEKQYEQIIPAVFKKNPSGIINLSTSVRGDTIQFNSDLRRTHLKKYAGCNHAPDMASFSIGPVVFSSGGGYENPDDYIVAQMQHFKEHGIRPEIEIFNKTILNNILGGYAEEISDLGTPVLFMLIIGVEQSKSFADQTDDSLIPSADSKQVLNLLQDNDLQSRQSALRILLQHLKPIVQSIRMKYGACKLSLLTAGAMQALLVDLAVALDLDGVRVGMEDTLSIYDPKVPGEMRRSTSSAEQVRNIKAQLEALNYNVLTAEELRDELDMQRAEVQLFRRVNAKLRPYAANVLEAEKLPTVTEMQNILSAEFLEYRKLEDQFVADILAAIKGDEDADALSNIINDNSYALGIYIRYFIEEKDRYDNFTAMPFNDLYVLQNLNFMREVLHDRALEYDVIDRALAKHVALDCRIQPNQFKTAFHRFIEYLTDIPCRYNADRSAVFNYILRQDESYSATMAMLFACSKHMMLELRKRSKSYAKTSGNTSFIVGAPNQENTDWIMLPSTTTTNYPLGIKLANGLAEVFYRFITSTVGKLQASNLALLAFTHSGCEENGEEVIEASMLYNRFSANTDTQNKFACSSVRVIAEKVFLPRIIKDAHRLLYNDAGLLIRNEDAIPLDCDRNPVVKISTEEIATLPMLKLLAHSSGITTAQQIDNIVFQNMQILGYSLQECRAIFNRAIILSFASASDIHIDSFGTAVIDLTACNDIRSLAGTTSQDYICTDYNITDAFKLAKLKFSSGTAIKEYDNKLANVIYKIGRHGKSLLRVKDLYLLSDPLRLHDGHSIKRYLTDTPDIVKSWVKYIYNAPKNIAADVLFARLFALTKQTTVQNEKTLEGVL
jgi:uncharacterized protein (DUF849 family)